MNKFILTKFSIRSRFGNDYSQDFNTALTDHIEMNQSQMPDLEVVQVWHDEKSQTASADFDYFGVLWKCK